MESLRLTALHEAAHAVAGIEYGFDFWEADIIETEEYLGIVRFNFNADELFDNIQGYSDTIDPEVLDKRVMEHIIVLLAGYEAELKAGIENSTGAEKDFHDVVSIALCHYGTDAQKFVDSAHVTTKTFINHHWKVIELVAENLLKEKKLPFEELKKIVESVA